MKLIVDASIPEAALASFRGPTWEIERFGDATASDAEVISIAAASGAAAVVFLGRQALGRPDVIKAGQQGQIAILATETNHPLNAVTYLVRNKGRLRRILPRPGLFIVQSDDVLDVSEPSLS
jgi:hypothetical protein